MPIILPPLFPRSSNRATTLAMPGVVTSIESTNQSVAANTVYYHPFVVVGYPILVTSLSIYVQIASSTSGCKSRLHLYAASSNWTPGALMVDGGEVACDSTGAKTATVSVVLPVGLYCARVDGDGSANRPQLYTYRGSPITGTWLGANTQFNYQFTQARTYAAAENPAAGTSFGYGTSSAGHMYMTRMEWT